MRDLIKNKTTNGIRAVGKAAVFGTFFASWTIVAFLIYMDMLKKLISKGFNESK